MSTQTLSRRIRSPEDIQVGDYITVTHTRYQLLPDNLDANVCGQEVDPIELVAMPYDAGEPKKVLAVSLPFVMVERTANGMREAIDTRRHALVKVDPSYAKSAKSPKPKTKSNRKNKKRKGKGKGKGKKGKKK